MTGSKQQDSKHSPRQANEAGAVIRETVKGAGDAARQGARAVQQGSHAAAAARRHAQDWAEQQRAFAQIAVEHFEAVGIKVLQAMQQATEDACTLMTAPNTAARGNFGLKDLQDGMAGVVEGVIRTNLRATQELFRLADPGGIIDLQRRFAGEYLDALLQGSATMVRAARHTAEETLRPLEADIEQRRQARHGSQARSNGAGDHDGKVADVMSTQVRVVGPDDTVQHAARLMREQDIGALPVNEGDKLVGMLTDRDVALRLVAEGRDPARTKVREVMTRGVRYVFEDEQLSHAAENMAEQKVRRLPVVNRDKRLVGVLSLGDLALNGNQRWLAGRAPTDAERETAQDVQTAAAE